MTRRTSTQQKRYTLTFQFRAQGGLCYWCGEQMDPPPANGYPNGVRLLPKAATVDHLDSRLSDGRGKHPGTRRLVVACFRCNMERSRIECRSMPVEELRRRSGRYGESRVVHKDAGHAPTVGDIWPR